MDLARNATGIYEVDFNRAYIPYCYYNPTYECPYPPRGEPAEDSDPRRRTDEEVEVDVCLRAIVFDFDGVIANSEPLHFRALPRRARRRRRHARPRPTTTRGTSASTMSGVFEAIGGRPRRRRGRATQIAELVARKAVRLEELERDVSVLFPGAADAIRRAAARDADRDRVRRARRRDPARARRAKICCDCFAAIVAAEDTPVSKPAPDPYLRAVALLAPHAGGDLRAAECVAIEDSHWGLESAREAGLHTVAVTNTYPAARAASRISIIPSLGRLGSDGFPAALSE